MKSTATTTAEKGGIEMTVNGRRSFTCNGRKFFVQDTPKQDKRTEDDNYYLTMMVNGLCKIAYLPPCWDPQHFRTIKDAQRFVMFNCEALVTW